ncbi:cytoplasmic polyadenylation element-binding protein 2-like isoform X1 [Ptychodera flava]|uniref:cytoplasmic polyadenylation element-binding protein 2-like isoform X1 n=1 Tax=Ptychodera flava TaxID=63121 RepID=UPI00396A266D
MGEYGFGLNTSNPRALSPIEFYNSLNTTTSLFSSESPTMQDDMLAEKTAGKQQPQQLSPGVDHSSDNSEDLSPLGRSKSEGSSPVTVPDKIRSAQIETTTSTNSPLQLGYQDAGNNAALAPSFWSTASVDDTFMQGIPTMNGAVQFQNFPPNPAPMFNASIAPQINLPQPQQTQPHSHSQTQRRTQPTQQNLFPASSSQALMQQPANIYMQPSKQYTNWSNPQQQQPSWANPQNVQQNSPWGTVGGPHSQQRRSAPINPGPISPMKKTGHHQHPVISPSKFTRSTSLPGTKSYHNTGLNPSFEITSTHDDKRNDQHSMMSFHQDRNTQTYDTMKFPALEHHLMDIMRTPADQHPDNHLRVSLVPSQWQLLMESSRIKPQTRTYGRRRGRSPFFPGDDTFLDDGHGADQIVPSINSPSRGSPKSNSDYPGERYSRKVFVGGLPPDIDEEEITASFRRFGSLVVDWPHKAESKSYFPPKGYAFLLFQDERSVQELIDACIKDGDKLYLCVSSPTIKDKPVQIRPWNLADSDYVMDGSQPLDPRKTIFVGGVPRPLRAIELAMIMDRLYGGVCYAGIDTDPELKYPKGAGRVAFSNQQSYIAAISARFVQLQHGDIDKRVEVKPYVLDDQMCDECQGARSGGKFAPFFCANVTCLQYYCEQCWATIHSRAGREFHKPLVKEGADRPRTVPFRWC